MEEKKFYDIHCHAFNLSHPNLLAFLQHYEIPKTMLLILYFVFGPFLPFYLSKKLKKTRLIQQTKNILSVMENDIAGQFMLMEECLKDDDKHLFKDGKLNIAGNTYQKMVLTPLMIDFGYKNMIDPDIHYKHLSEKPIIEQVVDIFFGINKYLKERSGNSLFEIYPFLGLNTRNYSLKQVEKMLVKYFAQYQGNSTDFQAKLGQFEGNIDQLDSNYFAGIKVYPLLGFDPWPQGNTDERKKVECLYEFCSARQIPITSHATAEGFVVIPKREIPVYASLQKWVEVLKAFPQLKLNLAHFGSERSKTDILLELVMQNQHVYLDFSYIAYEDKYYEWLEKIFSRLTSNDLEKFKNHLLFGSDFMMSLRRVQSYSEYLKIFDQTKHLSSLDKDRFGSKNPERFLFQSEDVRTY